MNFSVKGQEKPQFSYSFSLVDDGSGESKGNGDGIPQKGEVIEVAVKLKNIGKGSAVKPFVSLKNKARRYLNLEKGNLEIGTWKTLDGVECTAESADCYNQLAPQEEVEGSLRFSVIEDLSKTQGIPHVLIWKILE